jgi:hypothetical protein
MAISSGSAISAFRRHVRVMPEAQDEETLTLIMLVETAVKQLTTYKHVFEQYCM